MTEQQHILELEQRDRYDRRARPTPAIGAYWLRGKRRRVRREADLGSGYYVDHPGTKVLAAAVILVVLGILDSVLTLQLMEGGAIEANPVMAFFLSLDVFAFLGVKYGLTLSGLGVLLIHKNFAIGHPRLQVKWIILALLSSYGALVGYEMVLIGADWAVELQDVRLSVETDVPTGRTL